MASNSTTLADEDGDYEDWIELRNLTTQTLSLGGWYLTDDALDPRRWRFPGASIPADGFLLVFASGKNRQDPARQLHTNFRLNADGEYLALLRPDGITVEHGFAPSYPKQARDLSYGPRQTITPLVSTGDTASYRVPTAADASQDFTPPSFDDSSWSIGPSGFGFPAQIPTNGLKSYWSFDTDASDSIGGHNGSLQNGASITSDARIGGGALALDGTDDCVLIGDPPDLQLTSQITIACWIKIQATGGLRNIVAKGYTFSPAGEILFRLADTSYQFGVWNGASAWLTSFDAAQADIGVWTHVAGTFDGTTWKFYRNGVLEASNTVGNEIFPVNEGWAIGARGTGTERFFAGLIDEVYIYDRGLTAEEVAVLANALPSGAATRVDADMLGVNTSLYLRHKFNVSSLADIQFLALHVRYEDGFAAWLNGQEVARRNAPEVLSWDSASASDRPTTLSAVAEQIGISEHVPDLVLGNNVLAIQALNDTPSDGDFLITAELVGAGEMEEECYFDKPTPGTFNGTGGNGFVEEVAFSAPHGFYETPFNLTLFTPTPGAQIRYTTDGSPPSATHGTVYTAPVPIGNTTTVRATAFLEGWFNASVQTRTYIFLASVLTQPGNPPGFPPTADYEVDPEVVNDPLYKDEIKVGLRSIPTLSIVMDVEDLFGAANGVYSHPWNKGAEWERSCSVEFIPPDGSSGFAATGGIRIFGSASRGQSKKALLLQFGGGNGPSLDYPLFGPDAAKHQHNIVLRAYGSDSWDTGCAGRTTFIRDPWCRDTAQAMGKFDGHGIFVHLYLNGLYWGLYNPVERPDAEFAAEYFGGSARDYDAINRRPMEYGGNGTEAIDGDRQAWDEMMAIAETDLSLPANYAALQQYIDLDNFIDLFLIHQYSTNADGPEVFLHNNMRLTRKREPGAQFLAYVWDMEYSFWEATDFININIDVPDTLSHLYTRLRTSPEFRMRYADRVQKHLFNNGALTPGRAAGRWQARTDEIYTAIIGESARWGDTIRTTPFTRNAEWQAEINRLMTSYFPQRTGILIQQLRGAGLYPSVNAPVCRINGAPMHGGAVEKGAAFSMTQDAGEPVYFTANGGDPRLAGGAVSSSATLYSGAFPLNVTTRMKARALKNGTEWSALSDALFSVPTPVSEGGLIVTELCFDPLPPTPAELAVNADFVASDFEFLELKNTTAETLDLSGVSFTSGVTFTFPTVTLLDPGEHVVVVSNKSAFDTRYPTEVFIAGTYTGKLSNSGEKVALENASGDSLIEFTYDVGRGWPLAGQGGGHSYVPLPSAQADEHMGSLDYSGNWRAGTFILGSPGSDDPDAPAGIVLNEFAAHTDPAPVPPPDSNDWIELYNPADASVTLNDYYLSDDVTNRAKWKIPNGTTIPSHGFARFDEVTGFNNPPGSGFGLSKAGEQVVLSHLPGTSADRVVDCVRFKGQENEAIASYGRYPDGGAYWFEMPPSPGVTNSIPFAHLVLNEVMYHPEDDTQSSEYIKITNPTGSAINLWNPEPPVGFREWRIAGQASYTFPPNTTIAAGQSVLVVSFDPSDSTVLNAFLAAYSTPRLHIPVFGPWTGSLSNRGGRVAIERPQPGDLPDPPELVSWIIVDELIYFDQAPFTPLPDGTGPVLKRAASLDSGLNPQAWIAAPPHPGWGNTPYYTLRTAGTHGTVLKNPDEPDYPDGAEVTLTAEPDAGFRFLLWQGDIPWGAGARSPLVLTMDADKSVTAVFDVLRSPSSTNTKWMLYE